MAYQYKREPLTQDAPSRLANACATGEERLIVWTLLDTGLRVHELATLSRDQIDWQGHRLTIYGKGGPYGHKSKRRVIPMTSSIQALIEAYFALKEVFEISDRAIRRVVTRVANAAGILRPA